MIAGASIEIPQISLFDMFHQIVLVHGQVDAVVSEEKRFTYATLWRRICRLMTHLHDSGIESGDRIGLLLPNSVEYVTAFYAVVGLGAVVVNLNPQANQAELKFMLEDSGCTVVITKESLLSAVPCSLITDAGIGVLMFQLDDKRTPVVHGPGIPGAWCNLEQGDVETSADTVRFERDRVNPEAVAVLQYTGGTTGTPKAAMLTHQNLIANAHQFSTVLTNLETGDVCVCVLPLFHVFSMTCCMNVSVLKGLTLLMVQRFDPARMVDLFRQHRPAYFPGVPTMHVALLQMAEAQDNVFDSLKIMISGGASLPVSVIQAYEQRVGRIPIEGFGMTETSPVTCFNQGPKGFKPGSIGTPIPGTDLKIVDLANGLTECPVGEIGELVVRGPQVMQGYWNRPDETAIALQGDWLFTGDVAKVDEDGYVFIVDRKKDLIITGGFNVYPREVEEVLYRHPGVVEAAVVGVPDAYRGESVKAFIVVRSGWSLSIDDVVGWCRDRLSAYKVPREVEFRESLPKSGVGKILRQSLRGQTKSNEYHLQ